jgi:hypothetical protein
MGTLLEGQYKFMIISRTVHLIMRINFVEEVKAYIFYSDYFSKNSALYETM